jgi:predicted exporter
LRTVLPSLRSQQASIAELVNLDLEPIRRAIESACRAAGFRPVVCEPFFATLRALQQDAARVNYVEFSSAESDAFIATVQRYVVHKENSPYYIATPIYPHAAGFAPGRLAALERALGGGIDGLALVGDPLVEQRLSQLVKYNLALLILASIAVVAAALLLHFRSPRLAGLTFVPVACEILWLCGGLGLAGIRFHFFTLLVTPMLLSLAMDNALQLTQYYYDRRPCTVRHAVTSVGRAAVLTCLMVALIYGTMVLLEFPGVKDLGGAVLIGALAVLAGTLLLQPALLQLFGRGQPIAGILSVDQEPEA